MNHARRLFTVPAEAQWTDESEMSREAFRDRVGAYITHHRLEQTPIGQRILDATAALQEALVGGMRRSRPSSKWAADSGFRTAGDVRKLYTAEMIGTLTDAGTLAVLDREAFADLAEVVARLAGGRFEPVKDTDRALADSVARLGVNAAELSAEVLTSSSPNSEGGAAITGAEKVRLRKRLGRLKNALAEAESTLDAGRPTNGGK